MERIDVNKYLDPLPEGETTLNYHFSSRTPCGVAKTFVVTLS